MEHNAGIQEGNRVAMIGAESQPRAARVLLVEDHANLARLVSLFLRDYGYTIEVANSIASALQLNQQEPFDVVVSDLGLPDGSGWELMRELRQRRPVRGIAYSGSVSPEDIQTSIEAGFSEHLCKPLEPEDLHAAIQRVLAQGG